MGNPRVDDEWTRRLCDGLTGGASVAGLAAVGVGAWRGVLICAGVAVIAQWIRSGAGS